MSTGPAATAAGPAAAAAAGGERTRPLTPAQHLFPLRAVRLGAGPFKAAQDRNLAYLMALDPQRLLAPFRREAGLPALSPSYRNWEAQGLDGHMLGHVLSALALAVAATGDAAALQRLQGLLQGLQACQEAPAIRGDALMAGYLGGIPDGASAWRQLAAGTVNADNFNLNGKWVPWYNVHKTLAGLRDAHEHAGQRLGLNLLLALADWVDRVTAPLSEAQMQHSLRTEHGGMAEVLADVHRLSGDPRHAALARRFVHQALLHPLLAGEDRLTGLHANTQIPKALGLVRVAEETQWPEGLAAAQVFWQTVVDRRTVALGGNSVKEHFHELGNFSPMLQDVEGPESCNTYNLLKLTAALHAHRPQDAHLAYAERALFNHVLSAQHPRTGGLVYFTPLQAGHYRVYSQAQQGMWCCVGSGVETHSRHGELIYTHSADALWVNLYIASTLNAPEQGLKVTLQTRLPDDEQVSLRIEGLGARALKLRHPHWLAPGALRVRRNGRLVNTAGSPPGSTLTLPGPWADDDTVQLTLPMHPRLEALPAPLADGRLAHAVLLGPVLLAARRPAQPGDRPGQHFGDDSRMGHIAHGATAPEAATLNLADPAALLAGLRPLPGRPLHWRTAALSASASASHTAQPAPPPSVELEPLFRLHEARYQVYWPAPPGPAQREREAAEAAQQRALAARTIDSVAPGEQQPEVEHGYEAVGGDTGLNGRHRWRHASGWFAYTLTDPQGQARVLQLRLARGDAHRRFDVDVNGQRLPLTLRPDAPDEFYTVDLPLPAELLASAQGRLRVRFTAREGSMAGGLYGLRLLRD